MSERKRLLLKIAWIIAIEFIIAFLIWIIYIHFDVTVTNTLGYLIGGSIIALVISTIYDKIHEPAYRVLSTRVSDLEVDVKNLKTKVKVIKDELRG